MVAAPDSIHPNDYAEIARRPLQAERCALVVIDIQQKLLAADFSERTTGTECAAFDSGGWHSEDARAG